MGIGTRIFLIDENDSLHRISSHSSITGLPTLILMSALPSMQERGYGVPLYF